MHGGMLLTGLLQMIVLSDLVYGFLWRETSSENPKTIPDTKEHISETSSEFTRTIPERKEYISAIRKPSEVFRKAQRLSKEDKSAILNRGQEYSQPDPINSDPQVSMTFQEFKSLRQSLRNERLAPRYHYEQGDTINVNNKAQTCARDGTCKGEVEQMRKEDFMKDDKLTAEDVQNGHKIKKAILDENLNQDMAAHQDSRLRSDIGVSVIGDKRADSVKRSQNGDSIVEKFQKLNENHQERKSILDKVPSSSDKNCEQCLSLRHHALTGIVCVVWLSNFVFIAWVFFGRQSASKKKRIPASFASTVHTSQQNFTNHRSVPSSLDLFLDKACRQTYPARVKPVALPRKQKRSLSMTTVTSAAQRCSDLQDVLPVVPEESRITNVHKSGKKKPAAYEQHIVGYKTVSISSSQRSHINQRSQQSTLSTTSEIICPLVKEHLNEKKKSQIKFSEENIMKNKLCDEETKYNNSHTDNSHIHRKNVSTSAHINMEKSECHIREIHNTGICTVLSEHKQNSCVDNSQISCKSLQKNNGQGEPCTGTAEIKLDTKLNTVEMVEQNSHNKIDSAEDHNLISSQLPIAQNKISQVSLKDTNQVSLTGTLTKILPTNCPSNVSEEKCRNNELNEGQRCLLQQPLTEQKQLDDQGSQRSRVMQAKSGINNGQEIRMGDLRVTSIDEPGVSKRFWNQGIKPTTCVSPGSDHTEQLINKKQDSKCCDEQKDARQHCTDMLADDEMAPPPLGYHVRKDFSNPDSDIGFYKRDNLASSTDVNVFRKHNTDGSCHPLKLRSSDETVSCHGKECTWKIVCPKKQGINSHHHHEYLNDYLNTDKRKRTRKLVIIGKLNSSNGTHKRQGKHGSKTHMLLTRENKSIPFDGIQTFEQDDGHDSRVAKISSKPFRKDEQILNSAETFRIDDSTKFAKSGDANECLRSPDSELKYYCKVISNENKDIPGLYFKKNSRHQSLFKLSNGIYLKRIDVKLDPHGDKSSKRPNKAIESQSCIKVTAERKKHTLGHKPHYNHDEIYTKLDLMPSCHMNVNSNAGIFEPCAEETHGEKLETRQASGTSILNSEQFYSTQTDIEGNSMSSDVEVLRSASLTQKKDLVVTAVTQQISEPLLIANKSSDHIMQVTQEKDEKSHVITERYHETYSEKVNRKSLIQTFSEKAVNMKGVKQTNRSHTALRVTPNEFHVLATANRRKKKINSVDTIAYKFEDSLSKKIISTTPAKNNRRILMSKPRLEQQNQPPPPAGDVDKPFFTSLEKSNKHLADSARCAKLIKGSEDQYENMDIKLKQKSCYEINLAGATLKEPNFQTRALHKTQNQEVRSTESDHHHSSLKLSGTASKNQEVMKRLVSLPKAMPSQMFCKKSCLPLNHQTYTTDVHDIRNVSGVKSLVTVKLNLPPISAESQKVDELFCNSSLKSEITNKTNIKKVGEFLMNESKISPKQDLDISPRKELNTSPKKELTSSPKRELNISPKRELTTSPKKELNTSPKKESNTSSKKELNTSPKKELYGSPKRELNSSQKELRCVAKSESVSLQERNSQALVARSEKFDNKVDQMEEINMPQESALVGDVESISEIASESKSVSVRNVFSCLSADSPPNSSLDNVNKHISRKRMSEKTTEGCKGNQNGSVKNKVHPRLPSATKKKKSVQGYKSQSRSPDGKKKKRIVRKNSSDGESSKTERTRKVKNVDKLAERKKKKKKLKQKATENMDENSETKLTAKMSSSKLRKDLSQTGQFVTSPRVTASVAINTTIQENSLFQTNQLVENIDSGLIYLTKKRNSRAQEVHSLDRLQSRTSKEKNNITFSADNIFISNEAALSTLSKQPIQILAAPSNKISTRIIQVLPYPKVKKNEKDLLEAELGWNSSTYSVTKALIDKRKHNQKRTKMRYYIVKTKPKKSDKEVVPSKLKRPLTQVNISDDNAIVDCSSELNINGEVIPLERSKQGQGKSVQFSDNIQHLEALNMETENEWHLHRSNSDNAENHSITKPSTEILKPSSKALTDVEMSVVNKPTEKKDEIRSQITPPRKKRPVWLKKSGKDKRGAIIKASALEKSLSSSVKQHHSSDNILKPSSRFNIRVYYPAKPTVGSPKLCNMSPRDKRNRWMSNVFSTSMKKPSKKQLAKAGSPVDIKELIEGSSVDATDHLKATKLSHEGGIRAAKSVPSLSSQRTLGTDSVIGKKVKASEDICLTSSKKCREVKVRENWSPRVHSPMDTKESNVNITKSGRTNSEMADREEWSTDVDSVVLLKKKKGRPIRLIDHSHTHRKEKKINKKKPQESAANWQIETGQDSRNANDLNQAHYCGDMMELNVLNMGLSWVMQSVVSKLPFLNQRQPDQTNISSRDMSFNQQIDNSPST